MSVISCHTLCYTVYGTAERNVFFFLAWLPAHITVVHDEELTVPELVMKFPSLFGPQRLISMFPRATLQPSCVLNTYRAPNVR
jgi:hypothetical protein